MKVTAVFTSLLLAFAAADGKRNVQRLRSGDNGRRLAKGAKRARLPVAKVAMCHYEIDSICPYKTIEIGETGLEAHKTNYVDDREGSCEDHCIEDGQMYDLDTCTCHSEDEGEGEDHDETEDVDHDGTEDQHEGEVRDGGEGQGEDGDHDEDEDHGDDEDHDETEDHDEDHDESEDHDEDHDEDEDHDTLYQ